MRASQQSRIQKHENKIREGEPHREKVHWWVCGEESHKDGFAGLLLRNLLDSEDNHDRIRSLYQLLLR